MTFFIKVTPSHWRKLVKVRRTRPQLWKRCSGLVCALSRSHYHLGKRERGKDGERERERERGREARGWNLNLSYLPRLFPFRRIRHRAQAVPSFPPCGPVTGESTCRRADTPRDGCPEICRQSDYQEPGSSAAHMGNFKTRKWVRWYKCLETVTVLQRFFFFSSCGVAAASSVRLGVWKEGSVCLWLLAAS